MSREEAEDLSQVSSINFGLTRHHPMLYLVKISEETKKIQILRNKIKFDPIQTPKYEQQIWFLYISITKLKEQYFKVKAKGIEPRIINAFVTFRDIQARNKLIEIYNTGFIVRFLVQRFSLCRKIYQNMLLLDKGLYKVECACDPETVLWENLGTPLLSKIKSITQSSILAITVIFFSYSSL
jgi:hypothetical protein